MYVYTATSGFFNTAGWKFSWMHEGYQPKGIGFKKEHLIGKGDEIMVVVENKKYKLNAAAAIDFVKKHKSFYKTKGTVLGVVSESLLVPITN